MNRTGLVIALSLAAVAGLAFALYPELDLAVSRAFYDAAKQDFPLRFRPTLVWLRAESMWVITALIAPAIIALAVKLILPFTRMLMSGRAALFLIATLMLSRFLSSFLFGISARDPLTLAAVAPVLAAVAMAACAIPAWRASRVDPMIALRHE